MNYKRPLWLASILGPLVFLLLAWFIYRQIIHQPNWRGSLQQIGKAVMGDEQWRLWMALLLMPVNWGLEARKWQLVLRPAGGIRFNDAFKAIFTGNTLASFTPNRMGEYLGRMWYVSKGKRGHSISLTIVCSVAQLVVTALTGMGGVIWLREFIQTSGGQHGVVMGAAPSASWAYWLDILLAITVLLLASLTIIYFRLSWMVGIFNKLPGLGKFRAYVKVLGDLDATILWPILLLSLVRYSVFIVQYGLVFPVFGVRLDPWQLGAGISVVFLIMAVVPTFTFLTDLGLRWGASIQVLQLFSPNLVGIFAASFSIWLVNLVMPALIGSLLILGIRSGNGRERRSVTDE